VPDVVACDLAFSVQVDIMDRGTDVVDILSNKVIPLRRGYVAVVNRSQADIQQRVSVREGLRREEQYFLTHPTYKGIIGRCGTANLAKILNQMLMKHVKDVLPEIKAKISDMIIETDNNLAALGDGLEALSGDRLGAHLLQLISKFSTQFVNILEVRSNMTAVNITEVFGGARITYIFKEVFGKKLTGIPALEGITDDDIRTTIANSNGLRPAMMMHELAFDLIVRKQIKRLEAPCLQCVELVFDEMLRMTEQSTSEEIKRFPVLCDRMREVVYTHLRRLLPPAQTMISNLIQVELGYLNTSHPDFLNGKQAIAEANRRIAAAAAPPSGAEQSRSELPLSPPPPPASSATGPSSATPVKPIAGFTQMFTAGWQTPVATISNAVPAAASSSAALPTGHSAAKAGGIASSALAPVKLSSVPEVIRISGTPTDREKLETEVIKILVESYFDVVKKNVVDLAPKIIMHFLVNSFRNTVQNQLVSELYGDVPACRELLRENDEVAEERARFNQIKAMLMKAMDIVNEVRDYNAFTSQG
jgi:dynamin 1-like protein